MIIYSNQKFMTFKDITNAIVNQFKCGIQMR